jgi:glycosyltransferase involved in cell wall biosynthesis
VTRSAATPRRFALVGNQAFSMIRFRGELLRQLAAAGAEVYAMAPDFDEADRQRIRALGALPVDFPLDRNGMNPVRDARNLLALASILRRLQIDMMLSYFIKPVIYGSIAARLAGVPDRFALIAGAGTIFSEHPDRNVGRRLVRLFVTLLYRVSLSQVRRVFLQNDEDAQLFVDLHMMKAEQVVRIPGSGVDIEEYSLQPPVTTPVTFIMMTRLLREKGVHEFAQAARRVRAVAPAARFVLLGDVDTNPDSLTEGEVRAWVDEGLLEWPGRVADVRPWLARASVFVLPSYYREGVPRSTLEALAMGRPVITTDWVGCRDTVIDGHNGFLVPVRDAGALAAAMLRFVENPALIEVMGTASRRIAETRFDVRLVNEAIVRTLGL